MTVASYGLPCLLLVFMLALSGCAGASPAAQPPVPTVEPRPGAETGTLVLRVTDDEIVPIVGAALYSLTSSSLLGHTDPLGSFVANELQPGRLEVQFQAPGHEGLVRAFPILAGEVTEASVILKRIATKVGYSETWQHVGQMNASVGTPVLSPRLGEYGWSRPLAQDLRTTVSSMQWTPTASGTAGKFRLLVTVWDEDQIETIGPSPIVVRVAEPNATDPKKARIAHDVLVPTTCNGLSPTSCVGAAPFLVDPVLAQRFTIYVSAFYWVAAPEDFSNLPPK